MNGVVERMRELVYEKERTIEAQSKIIEELKEALEKIVAMPGVRGDIYTPESYRATQEIRYNEQCRMIAKHALSKANPHSEKVE